MQNIKKIYRPLVDSQMFEGPMAPLSMSFDFCAAPYFLFYSEGRRVGRSPLNSHPETRLRRTRMCEASVALAIERSVSSVDVFMTFTHDGGTEIR
jgi:hypothetical protein